MMIGPHWTTQVWKEGEDGLLRPKTQIKLQFKSEICRRLKIGKKYVFSLDPGKSGGDSVGKIEESSLARGWQGSGPPLSLSSRCPTNEYIPQCHIFITNLCIYSHPSASSQIYLSIPGWKSSALSCFVNPVNQLLFSGKPKHRLRSFLSWFLKRENQSTGWGHFYIVYKKENESTGWGLFRPVLK